MRIRSETTERSGRPVLGVPAAALAALPLCPACYPAYAGILSALGLSALDDTMVQTVLTVLFLSVALGALLYGARSRRGYGPFALGAAASAVLSFSKFVMGSDPIIYAAVGVLVIAGLWNVWPRAKAAALVATVLLCGCGAIDAPPGASDLRAGVEPLAEQFDAEKGQHRLLLLLSAA